MGLLKFIFSKSFLMQLIIAIVLVVVICFVGLEWLNKTTNHDQRIIVPSLSKLTLDQVKDVLTEKQLRFEVQDSANFNPNYPRYSVIEQNPTAGSKVKENRKIYVVLNPSGYRKVEIPNNLIQRTRRQVEPTLKALGFKIGKITYKPNIATDVVLELLHKGKKIKAGDQLMKTSVIDLVVGDNALLNQGEGSQEEGAERTEQ